MFQVPALNLSSVARESPTKSPSRALQPADFNSNTGTALVFKQPKKVRILSSSCIEPWLLWCSMETAVNQMACNA